ncbi:uncharacterized protein SPAPADRAFT_49565 [Spathaspora passalidarum NRRL Y-27907]|uniref:Mannosyltransferase n=1 Tax=Spathaspora passalidarum (strain NRRL Y-27907 / 11-Y1) TaxID=619300 RepID=G3AJ17_SPAPN|nr:uncharacterized protein SPAPADRAFT_49565 [Spathaspora passalidarum NRRL Y-27907]EGW34529.1 hypothetical protein SPAPADRAFT_49565 [Spathaspora passalidarum NRRL Y-27907]
MLALLFYPLSLGIIAPSMSLSYSNYISPKDEFFYELEDHPDYKKTGMNFQPLNPGTHSYNTTVLKQLNKAFPYNPRKAIPKKVWKMWNVGLDDPEFPEDYRTYHQTWIDQSPEYDYIVKTNAEYGDIIADLYKDVPDLVHAYNIMPEVILKCDFARYLILFAYGGIYADMDTKLLKPVHEWFSSQPMYLNQTLDLGLVIGIEESMSNWYRYYARRTQINTWTIIVKEGHPMLAELISSIIEHTLWREKNGQLNETIGNDGGNNIINWTGPGRFTDHCFKHINYQLNPVNEYQTIIDENFLANIQLPMVFGDTMVLPVKCMNPGKRHLRTTLNDTLAYVHHVGSGTWKKKAAQKAKAAQEAKAAAEAAEKAAEKAKAEAAEAVEKANAAE